MPRRSLLSFRSYNAKGKSNSFPIIEIKKYGSKQICNKFYKTKYISSNEVNLLRANVVYFFLLKLLFLTLLEKIDVDLHFS